MYSSANRNKKNKHTHSVSTSYKFKPENVWFLCYLAKKSSAKMKQKTNWNLFLLFDLKLILRIFSVTYETYWLAVVYLNAGKWSFDRTSMIHQITLYHRTAKSIPFIPYDIISINAHICLHSVRYSHTMRARENALRNERFVCAFPLLCCYSYSVCA